MALGGSGEPFPAFAMTYKIDAPRDRVWRACTEPAALRQWWVPADCKMLSCGGEVRAGAVFFYGLRDADGVERWGRLVYRDVYAPLQLVYIESHANARGHPVRHPARPNWPIEILTTMMLEKAGKSTGVSIRSLPQNATDTERATFEAARYALRDEATALCERLSSFVAG